MKIIISPAKTMTINEIVEPESLPIFLEEAKIIASHIKSLSFKEAKDMWGCSYKIAELNYNRFQNMELDRNLSPAIFTYEGLQYQHISADTLNDEQLEWLNNHLIILSGLYGMLKPLNAITPYRLEMQNIVNIKDYVTLYEMWDDKIYDKLYYKNEIVLNLASKEYSKCVEPYLKPNNKFISVKFLEENKGKLVQKATNAKMARGEMVRFLAQKGEEKLEVLKEFKALGFIYDEEMSNENELVFLKK